MSGRQGKPPSESRPSRRQRQAEATRQEILAAARRLFVERGYAATTIAEIAAEAGVAVQTIYSSVGSKAELLIELVEVARHEADIPALDRRRDELTDPAEIPRLGARLRRQLMERSGDIMRLLFETAPVEPEAAAVWRRTMDGSRAGIAAAMRRLEALNALRPDLDVDTATDTVFALSHPTTYLVLLDLGWSHDRIENWLADLVARAVLASDGGR